MSEWYILADDNNTPVKLDAGELGSPQWISTLHQWSKWQEDNLERKQVDCNSVNDLTNFDEPIKVSTVFLGMDHGDYFNNTSPDYIPILFETMIFGGECDQYQRRFSTWDEAVEGHAEALLIVQNEVLANLTADHKKKVSDKKIIKPRNKRKRKIDL